MSRNRTPVSAARIISIFSPMFEWRHSDSPSPNLPGNTLFAEGRHGREGRNATLGTEYRVMLSDGTTLAPAVIRDMHLLDQSRALVCVLPSPPPNQLYICTIPCVLCSLCPEAGSSAWPWILAFSLSFLFRRF